MSKKQSSRTQRRKLERDLAKGKKNPNLSNDIILYQIKYKLNDNQSKVLINSLPLEQFEYVNGNSLPEKYSDIRKTGKTYAFDDIIKELRWYTNAFIVNCDSINSFLAYEDVFESYFLKGEYFEASKIITLIENTVCVSNWTIEKRLLLAEYESGFKRNKEFLTDVVSEDNDYLTNLLARHQSIRFEKNLSYFKYEEILNKYISKFKDEKIEEFLKFKLNFYSKSSYNYKGLILNIENSSSIVDRYNTFITLIMMLVSETNKNELVTKSIIDNIKELSEIINDVRILNILSVLGVNLKVKINENNKTYLNILNLYTQGNYIQTIVKLTEYIQQHSNCFELYEIYNKSLINTNAPFTNLFNSDSVAGLCLQDLYNIINKSKETQQAIINSHKIFNSIGFSAWSYKYFVFFNDENSSHDLYLNIHKLASISSKYINPAISQFFSNSLNIIPFLNNIQEQSNCESIMTFWKNICSTLFSQSFVENSANINPFRKELYQNKVLQATGNYSNALSGYTEMLSDKMYLNETSLLFNKIEIIHSILLCLLNLNNFEEAVNLVAKSNLDNPNAINKLRNEYLLGNIIKFEDDSLMKNISSSIVLHQYQNYVNPNDIWIAYDNFLCSYGLSYPKEIETIISDLDNKKAIYFLKHICKQEVFDSSYLFENQDELDNERIEVCSILTRLDEDNFEEYINEISEISRHILIRKGIKQIDESKIYVDVKGIKKSLEKDIRESFERSMNLLNLSLDQIVKLDLDSDNVIVPYYGKSIETNKVEFKESNIKITSYSRFEQFTDMFKKIRDKFIASNEFGIDTYLSMRIRHGTLLGEIRSVFENYYLITKKEDTSNKYKENTYWLRGNFENKDTTTKEKFNYVLSEFSRNIDSISDDLKNKKLQIRTENKSSDSLFDYSFDTNELLRVFTDKIAAIDNFEVFFEEIINILWERTENNLTNIREIISVSIKDQFVGLLNEMLHNIESLINKADNPEIYELIRNITSCQTDIKTELDKISEWFKRTNSKTINEFYIDLPIDATLITLKRLFKDYNLLEPTIINNCDIKFEGENFPHFTYIMQNLFHNILEHSKLSCKDLLVNIEISKESNQLNLIVENNFSTKVDLIERNIKIESTRQLLLQSHDIDKTRAEEGTGYLKIKKTLKSDLAREGFTIKLFDVGEERIFKSIISFHIDGLQKIEI